MRIRQKVSAFLHALLKEKSVPVLSGPLMGWRWLPRSGNHAYWLGRHEREYVDAFARCIEPGNTVFDIGAQAGYFTLVASKRSGKMGQVIAFEPFPKNIAFIEEHCELNSCDNTTLLKAAVGGSKGTRSFQAANVFMGHLSDPSLNQQATGEKASGHQDSLTVEVVTLDGLVDSKKVPVPDIMKIDTEGMEYWVLQGGKKLIQENHPVLFIATHGEKNQKRTLELLKDWDYEVEMVGNGTARNADYIAKVKSNASSA